MAYENTSTSTKKLQTQRAAERAHSYTSAFRATNNGLDVWRNLNNKYPTEPPCDEIQTTSVPTHWDNHRYVANLSARWYRYYHLQRLQSRRYIVNRWQWSPCIGPEPARFSLSTRTTFRTLPTPTLHQLFLWRDGSSEPQSGIGFLLL